MNARLDPITLTRAAVLAVIASGACALVLCGCTGGANHPTPVTTRSLAATASTVSTGPVTAAVFAVPGDLEPFSPRTVWIVGLDGHVQSRSVHPAPGTLLALSPSGRTVLYATRPSGQYLNAATALRALDLDSGRDSALIASSPVLSFGWDSTGRVVALTGTPTVLAPGGGRPATLSKLVVWHGLPGSLTTAAVDATMPVDASRLVASDGRTAYFDGSTMLSDSTMSPSIYHLWRYDFASHRLTAVLSIDQPGMPSAPPPPGPVTPPYAGAPPYSWSLPAVGLPFSNVATSSGGPQANEIDLLHYSDLKFGRSIPPAGTRLWARLPVFDATFSHYIARTAGDYTHGTLTGTPLPSRIAEVDAVSGHATIVDWPADPLVHPIGYLGSTRSFVFMSGDKRGVAVVLQEPGKKPRVILRIRGPYSTQVTWPGILGVQHGD